MEAEGDNDTGVGVKSLKMEDRAMIQEHSSLYKKEQGKKYPLDPAKEKKPC